MPSGRRFEELAALGDAHENLRAKSVRAFAQTGVAGVADLALRVGSTAVLARLIVPEHFGIVMMLTAVTAIADQFRDLGLSTVTVQRRAISEGEVTNLFWINVAAGVALAAAVCALAPLVAGFYGEPRLVVPLYVMASTFICGGLMVQHQALLTRQLRLGTTAAVRVLATVLSTVLAIALAWNGHGYWALVWREFARSALLTIGSWLALRWVPGFPARNTPVASLVRFGADLSLANVVACVGSAFDRLLLGRFWGASPTALYRQAYQLLVAPTDQLVAPVYQVAQPGLSRLQTDTVRFARFFQRVLTIACLISMPLSVVTGVYSVEVTEVMLGPLWAESAALLSILSLATFIKQPIGSTAFVLLAQGRTRLYLALTVMQHGASMLFMLVGVWWGTLGIAVAEVVATYLFTPVRLYLTLTDSPISLRQLLGVLSRPVGAGLLMAGTLLMLRPLTMSFGSALSLLSGTVIGYAVFLLAWGLMPGGGARLLELVADARGALGTPHLEATHIVGEPARP